MVMAHGVTWTIQRGQSITRKLLHDTFGGVRQGGVSPSSDTPNIFLFTDDVANEQHGYIRDRWAAPDLFLYCGEGQADEGQTLERYNGSVLAHGSTGKALRLFRGWRGTVHYVGEFELDGEEPFFWTFGPNRNGVFRRVVMFRMRPVGFAGPSVDIDASSIDQAPAAGKQEPAADPSQPYIAANESPSTNAAAPFTVDPDAVDRALQAHATTQNLLAEWLASAKISPRSPTSKGPSFDLFWEIAGTRYVAEVKSLNALNETGQLRLGLGQVLDYAKQLEAIPVLMVERRPTHERWLSLCEAHGVALLWPAALETLKPSDLAK